MVTNTADDTAGSTRARSSVTGTRIPANPATRLLMTIAAPITVNLLAPGQVYGDRIRQLDVAFKKIIRLGGQRLTAGVDLYNLMNNNVTLAFNQTYVPTTTGWLTPTTYMNPRVFRINAEFAW